MGISINGPSGIDSQYIIDSLVALEKNKVTSIQGQQKKDQVKIDAYGKLKSLLAEVKTKSAALGTATAFDVFKTSTSNENIVKISGGVGSVDAQYDVKVFQLSSNEKMISSDKLINNQNATLSSFLIPTGDITVDGVAINITNTDTLQDLRMKINSAVDADGKKLGVSASVLKIANDNFRLVLSSKESGSQGISYSGATLQGLGIIQDVSGSKGISNQVINSFVDGASGALDVNALLTQPDRTISLTGTDHDGRAVNYSFIKKAGSTDEDFIAEIASAFHGMANVTIDQATGALSISDKVAGSSQLSISSLSISDNSVNPATTTIYTGTTTFGDEGSGVLSTGKDAWFSVENVTMNSSTDMVSGVVAGVSFELQGISAEKSVKVSLTRDIDGIKKKFQDLIESYNALVRFKKESTKLADPTVKDSKSGDLAGDSTVSSIVNQIRDTFRQQYDIDNSEYENFTMLGLKTDTQTGEFRLDDAKFKKAVETDLDSVIKLFTTTGVSGTTGITLGRSTSDTKAGKYELQEVDAEHFNIRVVGSTDWILSKSRVGEIISFDQEPVKGLSLTAPVGSIGAGSGTATFTLTKGIASVLEEAVNKLSDTHDGLVSMRQESIRKSLTYSDERIVKLEDRIERYRLRLVKQFSDMEQAMSQMQSQSTNMVNSLSYR